MAFNPALLGVITQPIGGRGARFFSYKSDDIVTIVTGSGYFVDTDRFGVRAGDLIFVSPDTSSQRTYVSVVESIDSDGDASVSVAYDGIVPLDLFGALAGGTDDTIAVAAAFTAAGSTGIRLTGNGRTFAVSGNMTLPDGAWIEDATFKQLSPNDSNRRTLYKGSGSGPLTLRRVKVDRNSATTDGTVSDAAGIWISTIDDVTLEDVEVYGNGPGIGITITDGDNIKVIRPYIHDMQWTRATDPGSEQIVGLWFVRSTGIYVEHPRIWNLTSSIADGAERPYQTDGLDFSACTDATVMGGHIYRCSEGVDVSGGGINRNIWFYGTYFDTCDAYGLKFVHEAHNCGAQGCRAYRCGLGGLVIAGTNHVTHPDGGARRIRINGFEAIDTGYGGNWVGSVLAGIAVNDGEGGIYAPKDVVLTDCLAADTQTVTCTITIANPGVITTVDDHGKAIGDRFYFKSTGALPTGFVEDVHYYVESTPTTKTYTASLTNGGVAIITSGSQSGTHSCSSPTMEYGFRNAEGAALNAKIINPKVTGAKIADYLSAVSGIVIFPEAAPSTNAFLVGSGAIGTVPTWSRNVHVPLLFSTERSTMTLDNGLNTDIAAPTTSFVTVGGPTGAFSIGGIVPTDTNCQHLWIHNPTVQDMTIKNAEGSSAAANRIQTLTGADVTLTGASLVHIIYNGAVPAWILAATSG